MMNDALAGMNPYDTMGMYEQPKPRFFFKIPRVVPEQKSKFESDELFRRLSRECEIRYTGLQGSSKEERKRHFHRTCRTEGRTEIAFVPSGTNLQLTFNCNMTPYGHERECDFDKEHGKVHIKSHFIMNGVCVRFRGWIDLEDLTGLACLEYDERRASQEDAILRDQLEHYQRIREENKRMYLHERPNDLDAVRRGSVGVGQGMWR